MLASNRALPAPGVLLCLLLISLGSPSRAQDEDYDRLEDTTPAPGAPTQPAGPRERCAYDPCDEAQVSCRALSAATGCLCPGFSLSDAPPEPPSLKSVYWNGSDAVAEWCAPFSDVAGYVVTVGGQVGQTLGWERRKAALGRLENIAEVCVAAENASGRSAGSCLMYRPPDDGLALKAGLIGGALGLLLLLLLLAALLWRRRRQRKREAAISMRSA